MDNFLFLKVSELSKLSLGVLKTLHAQLRQDLEEIEKVLYRETASKCMVSNVLSYGFS